MHKIDLHTHSTASKDGGIKAEQYVRIIEDRQLDCIAITDHNTIALAVELKQSLGKHIIVGEEISTSQGELIGLFLSKPIIPGQTALATAQAIRDQGGLVYVPHPFETIRAGLTDSALANIADYVDIIEIHNGRALFQNRGPQAITWARLNNKAQAASSDAHGQKGLGSTYSLTLGMPTHQSLLSELKTARFITTRPPLKTLLYPKMHRFQKRFGSQAKTRFQLKNQKAAAS